MKFVIRLVVALGFVALAVVPTAGQSPQPVRVGGNIAAPERIKMVDPVYPAVAQTSKSGGFVIVEATIGVDGTVTNAEILRGDWALNEAALDAVRQWVYKPTTLNGVPVPVIMTVTVTFTNPAATATGTATEPVAPVTRDVKPLRVGGPIGPPKKLVDVAPIYPPEAKQAGVSGVVIIEATVGADGKVTDARILRSVAGLDEAALTAVEQWEYQRTLLNGVPVPIIMTITVNFTLR